MSVKSFLGRKVLITVASVVLGTATVAGVSGFSSAASPVTLTAASSPSPAPQAKTGASSELKNLRRHLVAIFVRTTAKDTDQTVQQVRQQLRDGKSLNDIAGNKASQVEQQSISAVRDWVSNEVKAGKITQQQANALMAKLQTVADKIMAAHHQDKNGASQNTSRGA